jgi:hypothetical protein
MMIPLECRFPKRRVADLEAAVAAAMRRLLEAAGATGAARAGGGRRPRVAITAGSRGITNVAEVYRLAGRALTEAGYEPFIVAAMGSHGGGEIAGQAAILRDLGVTPETTGMRVVSVAETVEIGRTTSGLRVWCDRAAFEADAILVVNRIKPHTAFRGRWESGLLKMMAVGLGKRSGARQAHRLGLAEMPQAIRDIARVVLAGAPILGGLAIVEDAHHQTAVIEGLLPEEIEAREAELLPVAAEYMARLPVEELDLLIVERMGKNISGSGMDTNVLGLVPPAGGGRATPRIGRIVALDLADESHGNATGIGLADFTTERLVRKIDRAATYLNCVTSGLIARAKIPMSFPTDREAVEAALASLLLEDEGTARVGRIRDTLNLERIEVSENLVAEATSTGWATVTGDGRGARLGAPLTFDTRGNLV